MDTWLQTGRPAITSSFQAACDQFERHLAEEQDQHRKEVRQMQARISSLEEENKTLKARWLTRETSVTPSSECAVQNGQANVDLENELNKLYHAHLKLKQNFQALRKHHAERGSKIKSLQATIERLLASQPIQTSSAVEIAARPAESHVSNVALPPHDANIDRLSPGAAIEQPARPSAPHVNVFPLPLTSNSPDASQVKIKQEPCDDLDQVSTRYSENLAGEHAEPGHSKVKHEENAEDEAWAKSPPRRAITQQETLDLDDAGVAFPTPKKRWAVNGITVPVGMYNDTPAVNFDINAATSSARAASSPAHTRVSSKVVKQPGDHGSLSPQPTLNSCNPISSDHYNLRKRPFTDCDIATNSATTVGHSTHVTAASRVSPRRESVVSGSGARSARASSSFHVSNPARPLRQRPLSELQPQDFKINTKYNEGIEYAFDEVTRGGRRAQLPGCNNADCCGQFFRQLALTREVARNDAVDETLMEQYLGDDSWKLSRMTEQEKDKLWLEAMSWDLATKYSRHRCRFEKQHSPPGYWDAEFPDTQGLLDQKTWSKERDKAITLIRYREAMRPGGRWIFADE